MAEELESTEENKETQGGDIPEWAKAIQNNLSSLPSQIAEALKGNQTQQTDGVTEIVVPKIEEPDEPEEVDEEEEPPAPKKQGFLSWLL